MTNTPDSATGAVPAVEPAAEPILEPGQALGRTPMLQRLRASVADPVLRILVVSTLIGRVGRGVFLTVTVLYFTIVVGLSPLQVALVLSASSAVGVVCSAVGGHLSDRWSARRIMMVCMLVEGVGLTSYVFADSFPVALLLACVVGAFDSTGNAARMSIVARSFEGPERVNARAVLRTVTNIAIAAGSALGGLALVVGTPAAYRIIMVIAGLVFLSSIPLIRRLPRRVDAPPAPAPQTTATGSVVAVSRWAHSPWRDPRYLTISALSAIFGMQFGLAEIGVPLWIANDTDAPTATVAALLILNTIVVIIFQVPLSRGTHDVRRAGAVTAWAGLLMAAACLLYFAASGTGVIVAVVLLVVAALAHAFAEVFSQAGGWGLSFELADPAAPGAYQGVFGMGYNLGAMLAPLVVTAAIALGLTGWALLAVVFLGSALGTTAIAYRAARTRAA